MPVAMEYREHGQVICVTITDPWDVGQMTALYAEQDRYLSMETRKIHTVVDLSLARQIPSGLLHARQNAPTVSHPNAGELVLVGAPLVVKALGEIGFRLMNFNRARFFEDADAAWKYVHNLVGSESASTPN